MTGTSAASQAVFLPCRRFEVEVLLGPHDGLTLVEQSVLRAAAAGAGTLEAIEQTLGLPPRMVLDVAVDLLSRGILEASGAGFSVHEGLVAAIGDPEHPRPDWFLEFQSGSPPEPRRVSLIQDLVAGCVFSAPRTPPPDRRGLPTMPPGDVAAVDEIPASTLLAAVTTAIRTQRRSQRTEDLHGDDPLPGDARVLDVKLVRGGGAASIVNVRGFQVQAMISVRPDDDGEPPRITMLEPQAMPSQVRRKIATALEHLWARGLGRGDGQFFDLVATDSGVTVVQLESRAQAVSPHGAIQVFDVAVQDASSAPEERQRRLVDAERDARAALEALAPHSARAELIAGVARDFRKTAIEALASAKQQVVLACPWLGQLGRTGDLQDAIRDALGRNVVVVLAWGIDGSTPIDEGAGRFLASIKDVGPLVLADRGCSSHAKIVACDLDWLVLSSSNFLNSAEDAGMREVGLRIRGPSDGSVPISIQTIVGWLRRSLPDFRLRPLVADDPALFAAKCARVPLIVDVPEISAPHVDLGELGINVWKNAWQERRVQLQELLGDAQRACVAVFNREHRDLLIAAIAGASQRLLLESHRVSSGGLSEYVVEQLEARVRAGVEIKLRHGSDVEIDSLAQERLARLRRAGVAIESLKTHAKLLVCDQWAVVSSHNFLSVDHGQRSASEAGVQVFDEGLVDSIWRGAGS